MSLKPFIEKYLDFVPSEEQDRAIELLNEFVTFSDHKRNCLILKGYAGTGKTSITGALVKALRENLRKVVLMAPTGRAAKVLSLNAGQRAYTIHKYIYRRKTEKGGGISLVLAPNLWKNCLFIVDEASMIGDYSVLNDGTVSSRNLLEDLLDYVYANESNKLLLIGDEGQLPPVGNDYSPALSKEYMREHFYGVDFSDFMLREVYRQAKLSLILENATLMRRPFHENNFPQLITGDKADVRWIDGTYLQEELESAYSRDGIEETIFITRSNKRASYYNQQIRSRILWFEELLCKNDRLMVVKNNYFWIDEQSEMGFVANGEIFTVVRAGKSETKYGHHFIHASILFTDYEELGEQEVLLMVDLLLSESPSLSRKELKELFYAIEEEYSYEHNKKKRYEKIMKNPYFNALQVKFAYAITCHKSQGGQWNTVFVDHGFLGTEGVTDGLNRWLYTAFTRAKERLYLVGFDQRFKIEN